MNHPTIETDTMKFYLFHEHTIIAAVSQHQAESLYKAEYDDDLSSIEEINDDYIVSGFQNPTSPNGGYEQIFLHEIVNKNQPLPFVVDVELV